MPDERPNILMIMTDQHRGDCLSLARHPVVQTPNLDTIGAGGGYFSRAYTTCPSCIPARRCLLSGQFPATTGMVGFSDGHEWHPPTTLPDELRKAGYQTALIGRTMHQWPRRKRFGFEHQHLITGADGPTDRDDAITKINPQGSIAGGGAHGIDGNGWASRPWHLDEAYHEVHWIVSEAIKWLTRLRDPTTPYFLVVSFNPPHPPSVPPQPYYDRYYNHPNLPAAAIGDWAQRPDNDGLGLQPNSARCVLDGERLRQAQAGYFGSIAYVDDQVGRLLGSHGGAPRDAFHNTVVAHTADHGEMLGDHYLFRKTYAYEGSAHIPMMMRGPGIQRGVRHDAPVCLEDIMPTFLDLAGVPIPDSVEGKSLAPILRGESSEPVRPWLHGEHADCYEAALSNHYLTGPRWKYIWLPHDGREQLFDLIADPSELHNLAGDAAHQDTLTTWRSRLIEQLADREEGFVRDGQLVAGCAYPATMSHASARLSEGGTPAG